MEIKIQLNTGNGENTFTTSNIKGKLDAIYCSSLKKVRVKIVSEKKYQILDIQEIEGNEYYPIRINAIDTKGHKWNTGGGQQFSLDEKIAVTVTGPSNTDVEIILKIDKNI